MRKKEYDEMHALESDFLWFAGMRDIAEALLHFYRGNRYSRVLDVGCGTGINLLWAVHKFRPRCIVGCDYSPAALEWCQHTLSTASVSISPVPQLSRGDLRRLPFASNSFDALMLFDVLDQLPPDGQVLSALGELYRVLLPGGVACVRVPAYRWLLSSHDYVYESKHRYSAPELAQDVRRRFRDPDGHICQYRPVSTRSVAAWTPYSDKFQAAQDGRSAMAERARVAQPPVPALPEPRS